MGMVQIKKALSKLLVGLPAIQAAYLFGSMADGTDRSGSDVDIAVRLAPDLTPEATFDLRLELIMANESQIPAWKPDPASFPISYHKNQPEFGSVPATGSTAGANE
jgi:predicted nucleotidyltransferase